MGLRIGQPVSIKWRVKSIAGNYIRYSDSVYEINLLRGLFDDLEKIKTNEFSFYPNPVSDKLFIHLESNSYHLEIKSFRVIDMTGKSIEVEFSCPDEVYALDLRRFARGIYVLEFERAGINYHYTWRKE